MQDSVNDKFRKSIALMYKCYDSLVFECENEFVAKYIGESNGNFDEFKFESSVEKHKAQKRYAFIINSMKYLFATENGFDQIIEGKPFYETYQKLSEHAISLQIWITGLMLQDVYDSEEDLELTYKYNVNRDLVKYSSEIFRWHRLEKKLKDNGEEVAWMEADGLTHVFDELLCTYLKECISLIKLQLILCILRFSPLYASFEHTMADELFFLFRDLLYNKRLFLININRNHNKDCVLSTRIEILFALNNDDRYCFRVDFPHEGNEYIHLNLNAPGKVHNSVGFPFPLNKRVDLMEKCNSDPETYASLFFESDEMIWFRNDFYEKMNEVSTLDGHAKNILTSLYDERKHLRLSEGFWTKENCAIFETDLLEAISVYGFAHCDYKMDGHNELRYFERIWYKDILIEMVDALLGATLANMHDEMLDLKIQMTIQSLFYRIIDSKLTELTYDDAKNYNNIELIEIMVEILKPSLIEDC